MVVLSVGILGRPAVEGDEAAAFAAVSAAFLATASTPFFTGALIVLCLYLQNPFG